MLLQGPSRAHLPRSKVAFDRCVEKAHSFVLVLVFGILTLGRTPKSFGPMGSVHDRSEGKKEIVRCRPRNTETKNMPEVL